MVSIEAMFGLEETKETNVRELPVNKIYPYPNQPFMNYSEERLQELADDIKARGLDNPIVVRKINEHEYQIIAGHNRFNAVKRLGWNRIPVNIKELTDEEAMIYLVQSNLLQRTNIKESEKVKAYALRANALKKQGQKGQAKYNSLEKISESEQIKPRTLSRYIACNNLIPEFLDLLDEKKISLNIGEQLAKLSPEQQEKVANYLANSEHKLTLSEVKSIVENQDESLELEDLIGTEKKIPLSDDKIDKKINKILNQLTESVDYQIFLSQDSLNENKVTALLKVLIVEGIL
ncbi:ParB N-terminal domain-containing protein [uncultured Granulicatella sp.]|uniref:ParB/RepB/Spo0J family partition protein n=1 Tax=uncultured Granulicatella sp. TaxID=316089 RepID=UPI0028D586EF|nr:ParB N-terminal domain-containing protein [uncultured Granulicatella sp.]